MAEKVPEYPLTPMQESFCQEIVSGKNQSDAYRAVYAIANKKPATIHREAKALMDSPKIATRISELKQELADKNLWTREKSVATLLSVIQEPDKKGDVVAAVKELNSMHGFQAPKEYRDVTDYDYFVKLVEKHRHT